MGLKVIIFDFDGVILDSENIKDWAFEELFKGYPQQLGQIIRYHHSLRAVRFTKFKYIAETILKIPYTQELEEKWGKEFSQLVFDKVRICPFVPGAEDFLSTYFQKIPMYISSINPLEDLSKILRERGLSKYFKKVYCSPWEKKDAVAEILHKESAKAEEAVFIGDAFEDYQAAQANQVYFIGRNSGKSFRGAKIHVTDDFFQINRFLREKFPQELPMLK